MRAWRAVVPVILLAFLIFLFADWITSTPTLAPCEQHIDHQHDDATARQCTVLRSSVFKGGPPLATSIAALLAGRTKIITAISTAIIAWFTIVLAQVGRRADQNYRAVERAFVFLRDIDEHITQEARLVQGMPVFIPHVFFYEPKWENSGTTPTRNMTVSTIWTHVLGDLPDDFAYPDGDLEGIFLGPKSVIPSNSIRIPVDVMEAASRDERRIYIWGRAAYKDIFGGAHWTKFCYRLRIEPAPTDAFEWRHRTTYGPYNGTDEDEG